MSKRADNIIIKSIFRSLIGSYEILSDKQENFIKKELFQVFNKKLNFYKFFLVHKKIQIKSYGKSRWFKRKNQIFK